MLNRRGSSPLAWLAIIVVIGLGVFALWSTLEAAEARREALELADSLATEREAAKAEAERMEEELELERQRMEIVLEDLGTQRERADSLARVAAAQAAEGEAEALETGEDLSETLSIAREAAEPPLDALLDTASVQLGRHLEADRRTRFAFEMQIEALNTDLWASGQETEAWKGRADDLDMLLESKEQACLLCERELAVLRDIKDPGFLERLYERKGTIGLAGAGGALLALILSR